MMGSLASETGRLLREGPRHQVTVPTFYIGKYEVTQAQYQEVMGKNPSYFKDSIRPVENVSWLDAIAYCNARSVKEGLTPAYTVSGATVTWNQTVNGYRLPTEAEWEYACRAGTTTPYSSGDSVDAAGWYHGWLSGPFFKGINDGLNTVAYWLFGFGLFPSEEGKTHPVGSKQANGWGLYDMHGNVAEWCWDRYGAYGIAAQTNPTTGLSSGGSRVRRGGSWRESEANLRSASRDFSGMSLRDINIGFRVVRP
jgi:formylglycine-generating enzyme required for sulfatase activity